MELWNDQQIDLEQMANEEALATVPILHTLHDLLIERFTDPHAKGQRGFLVR